MSKCKNCNEKLKTAYIRENYSNNKRAWIKIGKYCKICKLIFEN